jgi:hypothetical protein
VIQHEKDADTVLICHGSKRTALSMDITEHDRSALDNINVVNSQGRARASRRTLSELHFDCEVRSLGECLIERRTSPDRFAVALRSMPAG